jgi:hypothetical protein
LKSLRPYPSARSGQRVVQRSDAKIAIDKGSLESSLEKAAQQDKVIRVALKFFILLPKWTHSCICSNVVFITSRCTQMVLYQNSQDDNKSGFKLHSVQRQFVWLSILISAYLMIVLNQRLKVLAYGKELA